MECGSNLQPHIFQSAGACRRVRAKSDARALCGPEFEIVAIGFAMPFQGAKNQLWNRDFPSPTNTYVDKRITSLAFNLTSLDVTPDMGPFEFPVATQRQVVRSWKDEMFPTNEE